MRLLLQFDDSKKIKELKDISELHDVIQHTFNLQPFTYRLQKFSMLFQDFADIEDGDDVLIEDTDKIKIISLKPEPLVENFNNSLTFSNVDNVSVLPQCELTNLEEIENINIQFSHTKQWPNPILLPFSNFSPDLLQDLHAEKTLSWDRSRELVGHLANYAYSFKPYPNKSERLDVCHALVCEYPYLRNNIGKGIGGLEIKLLNKLKKMRQADTTLEVKLNKLKSKVSGCRFPRNPHINPKKGELNWAPDHIAGETEESIKLHKKFLLDESMKSEKRQEKNKIATLMALTYSFRRELINNKIRLHELKVEYPIFFQQEEQFDEFTRLTAVNMKHFFEQVELQGRELYHILMKKKKNVEEMSFLSDILQALTDIEDTNKLTIYVAVGVFVLPYLLRDDINCIFKIVS